MNFTADLNCGFSNHLERCRSVVYEGNVATVKLGVGQVYTLR